jgi:hypothetical protein
MSLIYSSFLAVVVSVSIASSAGSLWSGRDEVY